MSTLYWFVAVSALAGGVLGLRFRVFIVVPLSLLVAIAGAAIAIASNQSASTTVLVMIASVSALQTGYVATCALAWFARKRIASWSKRSRLRRMGVRWGSV